jgi:hypothetical protein
MHLFFILWQVLTILVHIPSVAIVTKMIIISNSIVITRFVMNTRLICCYL